MKILWIVFAFALLASAVYAYEATQLVNDYANVITPEKKVQIQAELQQLYDSDTAQFAVVTIQSLNGSDIQQLSFEMANGKIGSKEKNNGILLLVAVDDHKYYIQVGRGVEPILNDAKVGRIARETLVPNFKNSDYGEGILQAVVAIKNELNGTSNETTTMVGLGDSGTIFVIGIIMVFLVAVFIATQMKNEGYSPSSDYSSDYSSETTSRSRKKKKKDDDMSKYVATAAVLSSISHHHDSSDSDSDSSSGFGGGFGGFGGGSFGGAGAGGSW